MRCGGHWAVVTEFLLKINKRLVVGSRCGDGETRREEHQSNGCGDRRLPLLSSSLLA